MMIRHHRLSAFLAITLCVMFVVGGCARDQPQSDSPKADEPMPNEGEPNLKGSPTAPSSAPTSPQVETVFENLESKYEYYRQRIKEEIARLHRTGGQMSPEIQRMYDELKEYVDNQSHRWKTAEERIAYDREFRARWIKEEREPDPPPAGSPWSQVPYEKYKRIDEMALQLAQKGTASQYPDATAPQMVEVLTEGMDTVSAAQLLANLRMPTWALRYADEAIAANPENAEAYRIRGDVLMRRYGRSDSEALFGGDEGRQEAARLAYESALELNPDSVEARWGLGKLTRHTDPARAIEYLEPATKVNPSHPWLSAVWFELGISHELLGHFDEARVAYQNAGQLGYADLLDKGKPFFYNPERVYPVGSGSIEGQELPQYGPFLSEMEEEPVVAVPTPSNYIRTEKPVVPEREDQFDNVQQAWQQEKQHVSAGYYEAGKEALKQGNVEYAAEYLRRAIELNPNHTDSYRELANVYARMEEYERAAMVYQQALKQFPEDERLRRDWESFRDKHLREDAPKRPEPEKRR